MRRTAPLLGIGLGISGTLVGRLCTILVRRHPLAARQAIARRHRPPPWRVGSAGLARFLQNISQEPGARSQEPGDSDWAAVEPIWPIRCISA